MLRRRVLLILTACVTAAIACKKKSSSGPAPCDPASAPPATDARVFDAVATSDGRYAFVSGLLIHRSGECNVLEADDDVVYVVNVTAMTAAATVHVRRATAGSLAIRGTEVLLLPVAGGTELRRMPVAGPWVVTTEQLPSRVDSIAIDGDRAFFVSRTAQALFVDSGAGIQSSATLAGPPIGLMAAFGKLFVPSSDGNLYVVSATNSSLTSTVDFTGCALRGSAPLGSSAAFACGSGGLRLVDPELATSAVVRTDYAAAIAGTPAYSLGLLSAGPSPATPATAVYPGDLYSTSGLIEGRVLFASTAAWAIVGSELVRFPLSTSGAADPIATVEFFHTILAGGGSAPLFTAVAVPSAPRIDLYVASTSGLGVPLTLGTVP